MKSTKDHLIEIRKFLSDKDRWEECWENNRITGYCSGSLGNSLEGIWCTSYGIGKAAYPQAYACVGKAILHICGDVIRNDINYKLKYSLQDFEYPAKEDDCRLVDALNKRKDHALLMQVLDLAIIYADIYLN